MEYKMTVKYKPKPIAYFIITRKGNELAQTSTFEQAKRRAKDFITPRRKEVWITKVMGKVYLGRK